MNKKNEHNKKFVARYFDKELYKAADEMTNEEMVTQLRELEDTRYWVAITKYVQERLVLAQGSLCALDPAKYATDMARAQGILSGLLDLQDMIKKSKETVAEAEKRANAKNDETPMPDEDKDTPDYRM